MVAVTKYPRLYVNGKFSRIVYPVSLSITQNIVPLSTATITLRNGDTLPSRSYLELFTPYGSAGMFRVRSPRDAYGQDTTTAELEHMISEVGDYLVKEEISKMMAANTALTTIFSYYKGGKWKLGDVSKLKSIKVAVDVKYDRVLDAMLGILEQIPARMMTFDFSTTPWTVNFSTKGRLSRNVTSATVTLDDSELVTRLWYKTFGKDKKTVTWASRDADTLKTYGVVEGTVSTDANMSDAELEATVSTYLEEHKKPRISVSIQALELSQITGEDMDVFRTGRMMRLALPDYNETVEAVITSMIWQDVYNAPRSLTVNLGDEEDTVVTFLHNLDSKGSGGGGGGKNKKGDEEEWSEYVVEWKKTDEAVVGMVKQQDKFGSILEQAGMTLNSKGLLVYQKNIKTGIYSNFVFGETYQSDIHDPKHGLKSQIKQTQNKVSIVVTEKNGRDVVNTASIVAGINGQEGSYVKIQAKTINLSGYTTMTQFNALSGSVDGILAAGTFGSNKITSTTINATSSLAASDKFNFKGHNIGTYACTTNGGATFYALGYT